MSDTSNYNIVEQARRYFYKVSKPEIEDLLTKITGCFAEISMVEIRPDKRTDTLLIHLRL